MRRVLRDLWDRVRPLPGLENPLVVVRETAEQAEAHLVAGLLREHGLRATVRVSEPSVWVPTTATGWAVVLVPRGDGQRARGVLGET